ncbi:MULTISPECIES: dynamin family protein [Gammaproteobacteria]|uniref:dynamin family protein n=1 Tax=Gammaproteobacteria TaxID=1236 RepID=UPI00112B5FFA|nr:dynamin family protein [Pseudomonas sp. Hp2]
MKANVSHEQRFIAQADSVDFRGRDLGEILSRLEAWRTGVEECLASVRLRPAGIAHDSALARQFQAFNARVSACLESWPRQWAELAPAQQLADALDDKVLLLVFGKFNAGKSSLCNFLAGRFAAQGKQVHHFRVQGGMVVDTAGPFQEGATETTTGLQGVRLGERLVLLDTPGLHSMTPENAALTRRFTDSADGVLWLTSSASPGQVQELDELARELHRDKPLLPVLTRSDVYEEDEADGRLVKLLRNKTEENRALQEADVAKRAGEKLVMLGLNTALLERPVSISTHVARQQGQTQEAMEAAGFERLFAALRAITEPALAYKRFKPAAVLLHHLDECVAWDLRSNLQPALDALLRSLQQLESTLAQRRDRFLDCAWRSALPALPQLLENHADMGDAGAARVEAAQLLRKIVAIVVDETLADFDMVPEPESIELAIGGEVGYDNLAGMVDYSRLHAELKESIRTNLLKVADAVIEHCLRSIGRLRVDLAGLQATWSSQEQELIEIKSLVAPR